MDPTAFADLCRTVARCRRCPTMAGRRRVLSTANGRPGAPIMFVAEAPGRLGAERTGVPLSGDRAGRRFEALLAVAGWHRADVFVTNAVLCNPRSADGRRNRLPTSAETAACRDHLRSQLAVVAPLVVVPLGTVALRALDALVPHGLGLADAVGRSWSWDGRWLFPLYHPGERARRWRSDADQANDVRALARFVAALTRSTTDRDDAAPGPASGAPRLMSEVPDTGEQHRQAIAIGGVDAGRVADRAAGLDDRRHP